MRTLTTLILAILLVLACVGCDPEPEAPELRVEIVSVEFLTWDGTKPIGEQTRPTMPGEVYTHYRLQAHLHGPRVAQEVSYDSPGIPGALNPWTDVRFVEHFEIKSMEWEYALDTHTGTVDSARAVVTYLAKVSDVDSDSNGFSMLPENMDGSVQTTNVTHTSPAYTMNPDYQASHAIQGRITWVGSKRIQWSIVASPSGVTVTIDGVATFHEAP